MVRESTSPFRQTRWWWIRHAPVRSDGGRIYGQSDIACDCGDAHVFERLAALLPADAVWLTSHLGRTRQTAEAIWAGGYVRAGRPVPDAEAVPAFAEQHLGAWQGQDRTAFFAGRTPRAASHWFAPASECPPGGESFADLQERVARAVDVYTERHAGRDIVSVAHGGSIRAAIGHALGLSPDGSLGFAIDNCSLTRLDHYGSPTDAGWRVAAVNARAWVVDGREAGAAA